LKAPHAAAFVRSCTRRIRKVCAGPLGTAVPPDYLWPHETCPPFLLALPSSTLTPTLWHTLWVRAALPLRLPQPHHGTACPGQRRCADCVAEQICNTSGRPSHGRCCGHCRKRHVAPSSQVLAASVGPRSCRRPDRSRGSCRSWGAWVAPVPAMPARRSCGSPTFRMLSGAARWPRSSRQAQQRGKRGPSRLLDAKNTLAPFGYPHSFQTVRQAAQRTSNAVVRRATRRQQLQ
jgi:hypothetical protein